MRLEDRLQAISEESREYGDSELAVFALQALPALEELLRASREALMYDDAHARLRAALAACDSIP